MREIRLIFLKADWQQVWADKNQRQSKLCIPKSSMDCNIFNNGPLYQHGCSRWFSSESTKVLHQFTCYNMTTIWQHLQTNMLSALLIQRTILRLLKINKVKNIYTLTKPTKASLLPGTAVSSVMTWTLKKSIVGMLTSWCQAKHLPRPSS